MAFRIPSRLAEKARSAFQWLRTTLKKTHTGRIAAEARGEAPRFRPPVDADYVFRARPYPGSRQRRYSVHCPDWLDLGTGHPLVMVLHGCKQTHRDIAQISGLNRLSDRQGFIVVYPFVTSYPGFRIENCWGWFLESEIHAGRGEVEDLWGIVEDVCRDYPVDRSHIHVTGLSSGAGMAVAMLVAHGDKVASGAPVAGLPYAESPSAVKTPLNYFPVHRDLQSIVGAMRQSLGQGGRLPPIQIIQSADDETVDKQAADNIRDSWGQCLGLDTRYPLFIDAGGSGSIRWRHERYPADGVSRIETLFLSGVGHGWSGGQPGEFSYPEGPDIAGFIWSFFQSHGLEA